MAWVVPEQFVSAVGQPLDFFRKAAVARPETWRRPMVHRSVQRPSRRSCRASSMSQSSRPARTSASNCRSHSSASNSVNQARNATRSSSDSLRTASSSWCTALISQDTKSARQIKSLSLQVAVGLSLTGILTPPSQPVKDAARVFAPRPLLLGFVIVRASSAFLTMPAGEIGTRTMASGPDIEDNGLACSMSCSQEAKRLGWFVPDRLGSSEGSASNRDR